MITFLLFPFLVLLLFIVLNCCPSNYLPGGLDLCVMADDINVVFICYCYCYSCFCCLLSLFIIVLKCCPSNPLPGGPDGLQLSWVSSDFHIQDALQSKLENNYKGKDRLKKGTFVEYAKLFREKKICFNEYMQSYIWHLNIKTLFLHRSRVETARLILAFAGVEYQDVRLLWGG